MFTLICGTLTIFVYFFLDLFCCQLPNICRLTCNMRWWFTYKHLILYRIVYSNISYFSVKLVIASEAVAYPLYHQHWLPVVCYCFWSISMSACLWYHSCFQTTFPYICLLCCSLLYNEVVGGCTGFAPSVRPSVHPSRIPCPLCSAYSFG